MSPAQVHLQHLSSILHADGATAKIALEQQRDAQKCRVNFTSFPPSMLQERQASFQSAHATEIARLQTLIRDVPVQDCHLNTMIAASIDALICHAVQLAQDCFPCHASARQPCHARKRKKQWFLPRAMACQHRQHLTVSKACRLAGKKLLCMRQAGITFAECMHLPDLLSIICMSPAQSLMVLQIAATHSTTFVLIYRLVGIVLPSQRRRYLRNTEPK